MELENGTPSKKQIKTNFTHTQLYKHALVILTATVLEKLKFSRSLPIILSGPKGYKCPSFSLKHDGSHHLEVLVEVGEQ